MSKQLLMGWQDDVFDLVVSQNGVPTQVITLNKEEAEIVAAHILDPEKKPITLEGHGETNG